MDSAAVSPDKQQDRPTSSILGGKARFVLLLIPYAVIDLEFFVRLSTLMANHASNYLVNALAFEACFLTSLVPLWMCLVPVETDDQEARPRKSLSDQVCFLVIMLLLSLMQFSSLMQAYDRIKVR